MITSYKFFNIILGQVRKIEIVKQSRQTLLKINTFQNLTQYLVYFKKYIKIIKPNNVQLILFYIFGKEWKTDLSECYFYFSNCLAQMILRFSKNYSHLMRV